jgi:hypothetical protein
MKLRREDVPDPVFIDRCVDWWDALGHLVAQAEALPDEEQRTFFDIELELLDDHHRGHCLS